MVQTNKAILINGDSVAAGTPVTSDWYDINGWVKLVVEILMNTSGHSTSVKIRLSSKDAYVLNNQATVTTADYTQYELSAAYTTLTTQHWDGTDDESDLNLPWKSVQFNLTNGGTTSAAIMSICSFGGSH